jgi:energy-coupling factor transport system ATP-binding protein
LGEKAVSEGRRLPAQGNHRAGNTVQGVEIRISDLAYTYPSGVAALRSVSLQISPGEQVAIVGQNGAGKTTLVKHMNGLLRPTSGSVFIGGWDTRNRSVAQLAARVGYVFQNPDDQLFQSRVTTEVMFGPKNLGWESSRAEARSLAALQQVGLEDAADRHPYDLSPGERKRVALAAVLAMDTPVIVLDEPTTGQDYAGVRLVGEIVDALNREGKTVITITHDIDFCAERFERVIVMGEGEVLLDGPVREVLAQAEVLAQTFVEPPQMMRLALMLGMEEMPLTVGEFVQTWTALRKAKNQQKN